MYRFAQFDACKSATSELTRSQLDAWRRALAQHSWVVLRTRACSAAQWAEFSKLARAIPDAHRRTIIEHELDYSAATSSIEPVLRSIELANASGFRHLATTEKAGTATSQAVNLIAVRRAMSIDTSFVRR
ncbi:MAG: hypothetical protein ACRDAM_14280, partial [Casimicrobium sp.]